MTIVDRVKYGRFGIRQTVVSYVEIDVLDRSGYDTLRALEKRLIKINNDYYNNADLWKATSEMLMLIKKQLAREKGK